MKMKRWILVCMMAAFAIGLASPAAGQTSSTTQTNTATILPTINWEVVPGALYFDEATLQYRVSVGCKLTSRDAVWGPPRSQRNSIVLLQLKLRPKTSRPGDIDYELYGSRRPYPGPLTNGGRFCDLRRGIDKVEFEIDTLPITLLHDPAYIEGLEVVVRYYKAHRYPPHTGLKQVNGQFYGFGGNGFIDNVNDNTESTAASAEEAYEW